MRRKILGKFANIGVVVVLIWQQSLFACVDTLRPLPAAEKQAGAFPKQTALYVSPLKILDRPDIRDFIYKRLRVRWGVSGFPVEWIPNIVDILSRHLEDEVGALEEVRSRFPQLADQDSDYNKKLRAFRASKVVRLRRRFVPYLQGPVFLDFGGRIMDLAAMIVQTDPQIKRAYVSDIVPNNNAPPDPRITFVHQTDPYAAPLPPNSANTVLMSEILHHVKPDARPHLINQIGSMVPHGGRIIVIEDTYPDEMDTNQVSDELTKEFLGFSASDKRAILFFFDWFGNCLMRNRSSSMLVNDFRSMDYWIGQFETAGFRTVEAKFVEFDGANLDLMPPKGFFIFERLPSDKDLDLLAILLDGATAKIAGTPAQTNINNAVSGYFDPTFIGELILGSALSEGTGVLSSAINGTQVSEAPASRNEYIPLHATLRTVTMVTSWQKAMDLVKSGSRGIIMMDETHIYAPDPLAPDSPAEGIRLGRVYGTEEDAFRTLREYCGKILTAYSGLSVINTQRGEARIGCSTASLTMRDGTEVLTDSDINVLSTISCAYDKEYGYLAPLLDQEVITVDDILKAYVKAGRWKGKTGGFSIQDRDFFLCVREVKGNPLSFAGLPFELLAKFLNEIGRADMVSATRDITAEVIEGEKWPMRDEFRKIEITRKDAGVVLTQGKREELRSLLKSRFDAREIGTIMFKGGNKLGGLRPDIRPRVMERLRQQHEYIYEGSIWHMGLRDLMIKWGKYEPDVIRHILRKISPDMHALIEERFPGAFALLNEILITSDARRFASWLQKIYGIIPANDAGVRNMRTWLAYNLRGSVQQIVMAPADQAKVKKEEIGPTDIFKSPPDTLRYELKTAFEHNKPFFDANDQLRHEFGTTDLNFPWAAGMHCPALDAGEIREMSNEIDTLCDDDLVYFCRSLRLVDGGLNVTCAASAASLGIVDPQVAMSAI